MKSDSDSEHEVKESSILLQSDEFDSDPPYSPSFLSSTDSDMNFEESNDESNDENNERASPVISYISDLCFPDSWTNEADSTPKTEKSKIPGDLNTSTLSKMSTSSSSESILKCMKKKRKNVLCKFCKNYVTNFETYYKKP